MNKDQIFAVLCREGWYAHSNGEHVIGALNGWCRQLGIFPDERVYSAVLDYIQDRKRVEK